MRTNAEHRFRKYALLAAALTLTAAGTLLLAQQKKGSALGSVAIDPDDIGGVVTSSAGPEAGVWVIAETTSLPTKFRKIVVTDDGGRYVIPDLPEADYKIWVRGYGLVDSQPVQSKRGQRLALNAVVAPSAKDAAQYYPADYWLSLMEIPAKTEFPMKFTVPGPDGKPQNRVMNNQAEWIAGVKNCHNCHQLGTKILREVNPAVRQSAGSTTAAWERRLRYGQVGMLGAVVALGGHDRGLAAFASYSDRIAAGELPPVPPRPKGIERNVVLSEWDISTPTSFVHDLTTTDKRNPTLNGYGKVYGVEFHHNSLVELDPVKNTTRLLPIPTRDDRSVMTPFTRQQVDLPSPTWGDEVIFQDYVQPNHLTMDDRGRVWASAAIRKLDNPSYCKDDSSYFSKLYPIEQGRRQLTMYDPKTAEFTGVDTCTHAHHVHMGEGANKNLVFYNGLPTGSLAFMDMGVLQKEGEKKAVGWCRGYFDVNNNGKIDPGIDKPVQMQGTYSVIPDPTDDSVIWGAVPGTPGKIVRMKFRTCIAEAYEPPFNNPKAPGKIGFFPRGIDIDTTGVVWTALAGSGQLASFDRKKCKVLTGEEATTGQHCPKGWTLYPLPGPRMKGVTDPINSDFYYYNFVDQHDTLGLGANTPLATGSGSDSLIALRPKTGEAIVMRVPYPMGFLARGMDGRIDDAKAGWKGRGIWASNGTRVAWHTEGGKGTPSQAIHFQIRPNPLAK
jgi:hypothetical protein